MSALTRLIPCSRSSLARSCVLLAAVVVGVAGCGGGGTKTVKTPARTVTVPATGTRTAPPAKANRPRRSASAPPSAQDAERYGRRTYVVQPSVGKRVFKLAGPAVTVTAADGSLISAFGVVLADSGDGTGQAVLLFRGNEFLGWASDRLAVRLSVSASGRYVAVKYGAFRGNDPLCCPSSTKTVNYSWNGSRIVADSDPPLVYGKQGDRLHLASSG